MDIPAKIAFLRKHQPLPIGDALKWQTRLANHPPLVEVDSSSGRMYIDRYQQYALDQHAVDGVLYELDLTDADDFNQNITTLVLFAALAPDAAASWLGTKETGIGSLLKSIRDNRGLIDAAINYAALPSGLP
jgi:hypothetical protein